MAEKVVCGQDYQVHEYTGIDETVISPTGEELEVEYCIHCGIMRLNLRDYWDKDKTEGEES